MEILTVEVLEAKPNKLFTEEQRQAVRFLRYSRTVRCQECGKKRKVMWTMLCEFYAHSMGEFTVVKSGRKHNPLAGVCGSHLLAPAWPEETKDERSAGNTGDGAGEALGAAAETQDLGG